jgi:hypothetical protein
VRPLAVVRALPAPPAPHRFAWSATVEIHLTFAYAMSACSINGVENVKTNLGM